MFLLFFFVAKKDEELCPIQDYHLLNRGTVKNAYPLLRVDDLLQRLYGSKYFIKLDI
jgi:hypothetical protein